MAEVRAVSVTATRGDVREALSAIVSGMAGKGERAATAAKSVRRAIGMAALSKIQQAFIVKAAGGTDDSGLSWPPLKKETIAYSRRFGKGERAALLKASGLSGRKNRVRGLLTAQQDRQWRGIYASQLARLKIRGESNPESKAAQLAWSIMKKRGAKTKLEVFGNRKVQILRDTGILFNSLSPGTSSQDQIFEVGNNDVTVGTNVEYAKFHHEGSRRLWPDPKDWPDSWWQPIADTARRSVMRQLETEIAKQ